MSRKRFRVKVKQRRTNALFEIQYTLSDKDPVHSASQKERTTSSSNARGSSPSERTASEPTPAWEVDWLLTFVEDDVVVELEESLEDEEGEEEDQD